MKYRYEYLDMKELGRLFGVSGQKIGSHLSELGLRDHWGKPSQQAVNQRLVDYDYERHGTYTKLWHVEKTIKLLEDDGLELASPAPTDLIKPPRLVGPFSIQDASHDKWQLVNPDNKVVVTVIGEENAKAIRNLMNLAAKNGHFERVLAANS
jgi:hypothetical protein